MSCLFDSLAVFTPYDPYQLRQLLCDELHSDPLLDNGIHVSEYVKHEADVRLDDYVHTMRDRSTWGGALEVAVFARMFGRVVRVHVHSTGRSIEIGDSTGTGAIINLLWTSIHFSRLPSKIPIQTGVAPPPLSLLESQDRSPSRTDTPRPRGRI